MNIKNLFYVPIKLESIYKSKFSSFKYDYILYCKYRSDYVIDTFLTKKQVKDLIGIDNYKLLINKKQNKFNIHYKQLRNYE